MLSVAFREVGRSQMTYCLLGLIDRSNKGDSRNLRRTDTPEQFQVKFIDLFRVLPIPRITTVSRVHARPRCFDLR